MSSRTATHTARGYTLLEMATVLALIGILAAISMGGLDAMKTRASFTAAAGSLLTDLRKTQAEASGRGVYTVFIIDTVKGKWWGIEQPAGFTLASFNPASPGTVIASGAFPSSTKFGPAAGYNQVLPAPFANVPTTSALSPNSPFCSFCNSTGMGQILFEPGGLTSFPNDSGAYTVPNTLGQQFTIQGTVGNTTPPTTRTVAFALIGRPPAPTSGAIMPSPVGTGLIETFEQ